MTVKCTSACLSVDVQGELSLRFVDASLSQCIGACTVVVPTKTLLLMLAWQRALFRRTRSAICLVQEARMLRKVDEKGRKTKRKRKSGEKEEEKEEEKDKEKGRARERGREVRHGKNRELRGGRAHEAGDDTNGLVDARRRH